MEDLASGQARHVDYLRELNEVQRQAVTHSEGPVLVVAGPGSGKTRVLTYRIAHLIQTVAAPWEVLALTFTNKAAREMKERIEKVVGARANRVWAGTFHSIFARILRIEAEKIGYPSNFTIYDTEDSKSVLRAIVRELNLNKELYNVNALRQRISSAKSNLITPKAYVQNAELMDQDRVAKRPLFHKVYETYMARCKRSGAMDFDDLLLRLYQLWQEHPEVLAKYQQRFRYVLVDEFQDTNFLQYAILKQLVHYPDSPRNICVVGDDAQSIYAFRGATIQNILDFEKDFKPYGIRIFKLEQNYRSTRHIVEAANELITHNSRQIPKTIRSEKGEGHRIRLIKAMSENEEGKRVADTILELKNRHHFSNSDFAILYRTNAQSRVFEEYLRRYNLPYRVFGGTSFYQRKEVKDLIAYLRLAVNPKDEEALRRVINFPKRGIGASTLEKISAEAEAQSRTMWEVLPTMNLPTRTRNLLLEFRRMVLDFGKKAQDEDAYTAAVFIAKRSGLIDFMKQDTSVEGIGRLENVNGLLDAIQEFAQSLPTEEGESPERSLAAYLQNIALLTDLDEAAANSDHITLMSVHAAKGLEFPVVFVTGLEEQLFPSFLSMESIEGLDEERRLFYVAITRAESHLVLTYSASRYRYGKQRFNQPSRFLTEISEHHLDSSSPHGSVARAPFGRFETRMGQAPKTSSSGAKVQGHFKRGTQRKPQPVINPADFKPSPPDQIQSGMKVLHLLFGEGKVLSIDGARDNRVATIFFKDVDGGSQKRILLKFAKLQVID